MKEDSPRTHKLSSGEARTRLSQARALLILPYLGGGTCWLLLCSIVILVLTLMQSLMQKKGCC